MSGIKKSLFSILAVIAIALVLLAICGCAGQKMYITPCEHKVPMEDVNKENGAVNYCPICKKSYPYIPVSRHSCNDDGEKWYHGLGWRHWYGPYGYYRPSPYYSNYYGGGYGHHRHSKNCDH